MSSSGPRWSTLNALQRNYCRGHNYDQINPYIHHISKCFKKKNQPNPIIIIFNIISVQSTLQPEETLRYYIYIKSLINQISTWRRWWRCMQHMCCVRSHPGFTLAAALKAKYPQGLRSAFQSKQPVIQHCQLTLNFLRIAPTATYSPLKHTACTPAKLLSYLTINTGLEQIHMHVQTHGQVHKYGACLSTQRKNTDSNLSLWINYT